MSYQSKHLVALYKIAPETLRQWTLEFQEYLSPTANPGANKQRFYTVSDLEILSLVSEQKRAGFTYEEIHLSLKSGQRGVAPDLEPHELEEIVGSDEDTQLSIQVHHLQHNLALAQTALKKAEERLQEMQAIQEKANRLEAQLETTEKHHHAEIEGLRLTIKDLTDQIRQIAAGAGEQYAKGFQEGWKQRGRPPE